MSTYPASIDTTGTTGTLPTAVDNKTVINAAFLNSYQSAIIQIETTLGVQPAGVYGTVSGRLTTLEGIIGGLPTPISLAGDLGGTPTSPTVIGIQGRPISSTAPASGQTLIWNGIAWVPTTITSGDFVLGHDLTGTTTDQFVIGIQGQPVPAPSGTDTLLTWNGSALVWATSSASFVASGDLSGTSTNQTVIGIQGHAISAVTPTAGQVLEYNGSTWTPIASSTIFTAGGDLSGTATNQTVIRIQGHPVTPQSLGAPQDGYVLTWDNADGYWVALPTTGSATIIDLGLASTFGILASSTVTNTGSTVINGDLGLYPGTSVTGFPPGTYTGTEYIADTAAQNAQTALTAAFTAGNLLLPTTTFPPVHDIGGSLLAPGVYFESSSLGITGTVTLNAGGDPNAYWIFQIGTTLTTASNAVVSLINGALARNVFWLVGSSATLGTTSTFVGNILAQASITDDGGSTITGRLLAQSAAITLNDTTIIVPSASSSDLSGDVTGAPGSNTVVKIQGTPVSTNSVANDGYALVSEGGIYVPQGVEVVVNVQNFGAIPSNIPLSIYNDATIPLQNAFAYYQELLQAQTTSGYGSTPRLYIPAGTYLCQKELTLTNCTGGIIEGDGMYSSIIYEYGLAPYYLVGAVAQIRFINCDHMVVRDIGIQAGNHIGYLNSAGGVAGTNTVTVSSFVGGTPSAGMKCALANYAGACDYLTIAQIVGDTVTFTTNLKYNYAAGAYLLYGVMSGICNYSDKTIPGAKITSNNRYERVLVGSPSGVTQMFGFASTCKGGGPVPLGANATAGQNHITVADAGEMFVGETIQIWDISYGAAEVVLTIDTVDLLTNVITFHPNLTLNHTTNFDATGANTCFIQSLSDENNENHTYVECISENATVGSWYIDGINQLCNELYACQSSGVNYASFWAYRGGSAQIVSHAFGGSYGYNFIINGCQVHAWTINGGYDESATNCLLIDGYGGCQFFNMTIDQYDKKGGPSSGDLNMMEVTGYYNTIRVSNCSLQGDTTSTFYFKDWTAGTYVAGFEPQTVAFTNNQIIAAGITLDGIYGMFMGNAYLVNGNWTPVTLNGGQFYGALNIGGYLAGAPKPNTLTNIDTLTNLAGFGSGIVAVSNTGLLSWSAGGAFTAGGDLSGTSTSQNVISITGASGVVNVAATGNVFTWAAATTNPGLAQTVTTTGVGANMKIHAQDSTHGGSNGGTLILEAGQGETVSDSMIAIINQHGTLLQIGNLAGQGGPSGNNAYGCFYPGNVSLTGGNYFLACTSDGKTVIMNAGPGTPGEGTFSLYLDGTSTEAISATTVGGDLVTIYLPTTLSSTLAVTGNTTLTSLAGSGAGIVAVSNTGLLSNIAASDDGYALVSVGGEYIRTGVEPVFNVKNFGAKGDGSTDDSAALLAAVLAFQTAQSTGVSSRLYFPAGRYLCGYELVLTNLTGGIIEGDGMHDSTIVENTPGLIGKRGQLVLVNCQNVLVRDIGGSAGNHYSSLSANVTAGVSAVTLTAAPPVTVVAGVKCALANYDGYCDFLTVAQVSGSTVTFTTPINYPYVTGNYLLYGALSNFCNYSDQTITGHQVGTSNYYERVLAGSPSGLTTLFGFANTCKGGGPVPIAAPATAGQNQITVQDAGEMFAGEQIQIWDETYSATEVVLTIQGVDYLTNVITFTPNLTINHTNVGYYAGSNTCFIQSLSDENNDNHTYSFCISENATVGAWYLDGFNQLDDKLYACESVGTCYAGFWGFRGGCAQLVNHAFGGSYGYNIVVGGPQAHAWTINGGYDESSANMCLARQDGYVNALIISWDQFDKKSGPLTGDLNVINITGLGHTIRMSNGQVQAYVSEFVNASFYVKDYLAGVYQAGFEPATITFFNNQIEAGSITVDGIFFRSIANAYFADGNFVVTTLNGGKYSGGFDVGGFLTGGLTPNMLTNVDTLTALAGFGNGYVAVNNVGLLSVTSGFNHNVTLIDNTFSPYAVTTANDIIAANSSGGPITINLPATPAVGNTYQIKDYTGTAATNPITINGNGHNIDGAATAVLNTNFSSITVVFTGSVWSII